MNSDEKETVNHTNVEKHLQRLNLNEDLDAKYGFVRYKGMQEKIGWLVNMQPVHYYNSQYQKLFF
jgi:hypothetical protein